MFIPAHIGISLGTVILLKQRFPVRFARWSVAFWPLCLAALLPDIVDKFLGLTVMKGFYTYRLLAHTMVFSILAILFVHLWRRNWIPYAWVMLGHLVLDSNWDHPKTMFFPLLGFQFDSGAPYYDPLGYLYKVWIKYVHGPEWLIPEIIGTAILLVYFCGRRQFQVILKGASEEKPAKEVKRRADSVALGSGV